MSRLTIGELADASGMTVRNIRNHQSRGLLPPPELEARIGYYGDQHLERLELIRAMQADGFNLEAIRRLLSGAELRRAATAPVEAPAVLSERELEQRFGPLDGENMAEAERLGVLTRRPDGRYEVPSPALLRAAEEAVRHGVGVGAALRVVNEIGASCAAMAGAFVRLFERELLGGTSDPAAAAEALRPVAAQTVAAVFARAMAAEAERALELDEHSAQ